MFYCSLLFAVASRLLHVVFVISGRLHLEAALVAGRSRGSVTLAFPKKGEMFLKNMQL